MGCRQAPPLPPGESQLPFRCTVAMLRSCLRAAVAASAGTPAMCSLTHAAFPLPRMLVQACWRAGRRPGCPAPAA